MAGGAVGLSLEGLTTPGGLLLGKAYLSIVWPAQMTCLHGVTDERGVCWCCPRLLSGCVKDSKPP